MKLRGLPRRASSSRDIGLPGDLPNVTRVDMQLKAMRMMGQNQVTVMMWYGPIVQKTPVPDVYRHLVNSRGGSLSLQHRQNLRQLARLIAKNGFKRFILRFGQQGYAVPSADWLNAAGLSGWREAQMQENWNFIKNTRAIVEQELANTAVERVYDLGVELGGSPNGVVQRYTTFLWENYTRLYGSSDSYGFSYAWYPGRVALQTRLYKSAGLPVPNRVALDIYGPPLSEFSEYRSYLDSVREVKSSYGARSMSSLPEILLQEVYFNDAETAGQFASAMAASGVFASSISQWLTSRPSYAGAPPRQFSPEVANMNDYGIPFAPYLFSDPAVRCERAQCKFAVGFGADQPVQLTIKNRITGKVALLGCVRTGIKEIPFIKTEKWESYQIVLYTEPTCALPSAGARPRKSIVVHTLPTPVIQNVSVNNNVLQVTGTDFGGRADKSCSVGFFTLGLKANLVKRVVLPQCAAGSLRLALPPEVLAARGSRVFIHVNNVETKRWSTLSLLPLK